MPNDRFAPSAVSRAIDRAFADLVLPMAKAARPLRIYFPAAATTREVQHGLGETPDGFLLVHADALVTAVPGLLWTSTLAYLTTPTANARAIVIFYKLKESPTDA